MLKSLNKTAVVYAWAIVMTVLFIFSAFLNLEGLSLHQKLRSALSERLKRDIPVGTEVHGGGMRVKRAIYVLGGDQESLEERFAIAANLYKSGLAIKILVLSRPGITAYDAELDRNLTNDEWSLRQLTAFGVAPDGMEAIFVEEGFFGTLAEARKVSKAVSEKDYDSLILVTSPYHTERAWRAFSGVTGSNKPELYVYSSKDWGTLAGLVIEYAKLLTYEILLI